MSTQIHFPNRRRWSCFPAAMVLLLALGLSACGHTKLTHFDGTPFTETGPRLALDNGWVAVDSCATGHHAVMVMEVEAAGFFPIVPRWVHAGALGTMRDFRIDGPWCRQEYDNFYGEDYEEPLGMQKYGRSHGEEHCVYLVRAEYTLAPPVAADSVYLAHLRDALPQPQK